MDQDDTTALPGLIDITEDQLDVASPTARAKAQQAALEASVILMVDPLLCDVWPGNTRDTAAVAEEVTSELKIAIDKVGQQVPVIARKSPHATRQYETVAGARRLTVIRRINEERVERGEPPLPILLELRELDDRAAFELMDSENSGRSTLAPIEKARSYAFAIAHTYATQEALAEALGLNKSNVSRTMALLELPGTLLDVIADPRRISAGQASRFMADWRKEALRPTFEAVISELQERAPVSASEALKAMQDAVADAQPPAVVPVLHEEREIGSLSVQPSGSIRIELAPEGRRLGVARARAAIRAALTSLVKPPA